MFKLRTLIVLAFCFAVATGASADDKPKLIKIRVGWQVPWATQGQLVQIWKRTDILRRNGIEAEFVGRTFGPQLNELALAGAVDVVLTADQPAATLFAKEKGWIGVGRLMYNRTSTYVPPNSPARELKDLKGKTIGIPVGAAAERVTLAALARAGLDPKKDVKVINLGIQEQGPLVMNAEKKSSWGQFDALSGFDPLPAVFEAKGWVRTLDVGKVVSLVVMNESFLRQNKNAAEKVMTALLQAYDYYRLNTVQANAWFIEGAGIKDADQKACDLAASLEPNLKATSAAGMRVSFNDEDFKIMQSAADFLEPQLKKRVDMSRYVSNRYVGGLKF